MAKCDREFLIPYLEDICTLELMSRKLISERYSTKNIISNIENFYIPNKPKAPRETNDWFWEHILYAVAIVFMLPLLAVRGGFLVLVGLIPCCMILVCAYFEAKKEFEEECSKYRNETARRNQALNQRELEWAKLLALRERLSAQNKEIQMVSDLLQKAYSANIIPGQYRNLYASVFLYDYFSKARFADDLDMVLNTFVLEQIKDRLDTIITQLSEVLINQSISISKQEDALEQQKKYQKRMEHKISQIQASNEEQEMYLDMIESHTRITAYFAAENYFNKRN